MALGLALWGGFQNFALKWGKLDAPKTCPTGFIAVPWNAEFLQPWFCVAKYEMSYENVISPNTDHEGVDWNTVKYSSTGVLVSKSWLYPIAEISQTQAISECQRIWKHLISNNEWMTIARNIEANGDNWNSGQVWVGWIFRGIIWENPEILWCQTVHSSGSGARPYASRSLTTDTTKWGASKWNDCDSKRQMKLSNGVVIWDIAGNLWEHVNGKNTINWENNATMNANVCGTEGSVGWNRYSFTNNVTTDAVLQCNFTNWYSYANIWPKTPNMNLENGIGRIVSYNTNNTTTDRVSIRGGCDGDSGTSGLYAMFLPWDTFYQNRHVGFRCAQ